MDQSRLLIIGAHGQLGRALCGKYPKAQAVDSNELDISSQQAVDAFDWASVEVIINAAAYTNVDGAETADGRKTAWAVNATAVANLARVAIKNDLTLVHVSSDYVFDGTEAKHTEEEPLSPLSVYGGSKAAGDVAASLVPEHYIVRTSWVIGDGKNFVRTMLGLGQKGIAPTVVADQIGRLTFTSELIRVIDHLLTQECPFGTYNVSNDGEPISWADITREIFKNAGFDLVVSDTSTEEYYKDKEGIAPRPLQSTLSLTKIMSTGFNSKDWRESLVEYIKKERS